LTSRRKKASPDPLQGFASEPGLGCDHAAFLPRFPWRLADVAGTSTAIDWLEGTPVDEVAQAYTEPFPFLMTQPRPGGIFTLWERRTSQH
jgi:hypothetical protein